MTVKADAQLALSLMDLTSLKDNDTTQSIMALLDSIDPTIGLPAAICVYPQFVTLVKQQLQIRQWQTIKIATVTNFPSGEQKLEQVLKQTQQAIADGADEIDLVLPYQQLIAGDPDTPWQYVQSSKALCAGKAKLKVIIESGVLATSKLIAEASQLAIMAGADFVKTSTGKVTVNATPEAAEVILQVIKNSGKDVGFKAAGGVKSVTEAQVYLRMAEDIMGANWLNADNFRFGASSLLSDVAVVVNGQSKRS
ncbi:deoxyribose-phosphate aldolase [Pseudoalteromonas peptidolytica]|uniref:Deoxyribose-phosphate aldolase n=1 Tax=Pseudoalteromonas peptidolytica F12-50-A1 TaxID=1315280 RepID=A0A8I0MZQ9_9GAMM|nr:deoxyribose-phosphate aldolase [Pseudoalteromonas peptidolytica]MBE0348206.1 deoxyribose-phosphate aldolase [Pseudoalteromonas peptidolytica F12-50-A1]NLR15457.1 deoxyribose-phosphate aldolase [Pseudoalteromonas peptidolytica]GEK08587.1 deoxyribose-phosphate aldolase [Pseudoalteromonas peptidolytica]